MNKFLKNHIAENQDVTKQCLINTGTPFTVDICIFFIFPAKSLLRAYLFDE